MAVRQQAMAWVIGNVAANPDSSGKAPSNRVRLRVLSNRRYRDRATDQWVDGKPTGTDVICWGDLARNVAASVQIGDPVVIYGRLEDNNWTDDDGVVHRSTRVTADVVAHDLSRGQAKFSRVTFGTGIRDSGHDPADEPTDEPIDEPAGGAADGAGADDLVGFDGQVPPALALAGTGTGSAAG